MGTEWAAGAPKLELTRPRSWDSGKPEQAQQPAVCPPSLFLMLPAVFCKELSLNEGAGRWGRVQRAISPGDPSGAWSHKQRPLEGTTWNKGCSAPLCGEGKGVGREKQRSAHCPRPHHQPFSFQSSCRSMEVRWIWGQRSSTQQEREPSSVTVPAEWVAENPPRMQQIGETTLQMVRPALCPPVAPAGVGAEGSRHRQRTPGSSG